MAASSFAAEFTGVILPVKLGPRHTAAVLVQPNRAADKPRKAVKPQAFPPEVGLIRVVVRRFAPRKQRIAIRRPIVAGAKRPRQRSS